MCIGPRGCGLSVNCVVAELKVLPHRLGRDGGTRIGIIGDMQLHHREISLLATCALLRPEVICNCGII